MITIRSTRRRIAVLSTMCALAAPAALHAQEEGDDPLVAATFHKITGETLDYARAAEQAMAVQRATPFDRPDVLKAEIARLQRLVADAVPGREFTLRVNDQISQYDHTRGEFSIGLFQPGYYVSVRAFGQEYRVVFANGEAARAIPMTKESARAFDQQLTAIGRGVVNEIRYRIVGVGDPAGGVTGERVVRAELLSSRLLDQQGAVVFTPTVAPLRVAGAPGAGGKDAPPALDVATTDVAGFRVGVKAKQLEATLTRLFGPVERRATDRDAFAGLTTVLAVNEMGCTSLPGRSGGGEPGAVCVRAFADDDDVVRAIRVERVFPWMEAEVFRRTMVGRYGPVAAAQEAGGFTLGWGPEVAAALRYGAGPTNALTAHYEQVSDFMRRSGNALPHIRVVLQLVDARWAAERAK
ncbi:MAG: DUF4852 domain-containing protein [Gemmatirosa sp.]